MYLNIQMENTQQYFCSNFFKIYFKKYILYFNKMKTKCKDGVCYLISKKTSIRKMDGLWCKMVQLLYKGKRIVE